MQADLTLMLEVLAGIEDVEASHPEDHGEGENKDAGIEAAADGNPCGGWSDAKCQTQDEVGPSGEALHVAVSKQHDQDERGEIQGQSVEFEGSNDESEAHQDSEAEDEFTREQASRDGAAAGSRVGGIEVSVGPAIEGHCTGTRRHHRNDDPAESAPTWGAVACEKDRRQGKGKGEDRVLPLDHLEGRASFSEEAHRGGSRTSVKEHWLRTCEGSVGGAGDCQR